MNRKIRIGAVNYLNTKPLLYGFEQGMMKENTELVLDYPAKVAQLLLDGNIDIGLVPVAILPKLTQYQLVGSHCIACDGEVASVCLFSQVPLQDIDTILLDYQSRTSAALLQVLLREYWNVSPELVNTADGYEQQITGATAGLVIGDRALALRGGFNYVYDLGTGWKELTGLPFVFAAWVANTPLEPSFVNAFDAANAAGMTQLQQLAENQRYQPYDLYHYYTKNISYQMDAAKQMGLELFLSKLR